MKGPPYMTDKPLPASIAVSESFTKRLPSQRLIDQLAHMEPGVPFPELAQHQPFRLIAFRALLRDYPGHDETSLWLHAYDVEVDIIESDPFSSNGTTPSLPSVPTGIADPITSMS
jgi:hypothetical protein